MRPYRDEGNEPATESPHLNEPRGGPFDSDVPTPDRMEELAEERAALVAELEIEKLRDEVERRRRRREAGSTPAPH